jgi:hypothetical protein
MDTSDIEKRNVQPASIECCYDNVKKLRLKRYMINTDFKPYKNIQDRNILGWISEDVQHILPKAIIKMDYNINKNILEPKNDQKPDEYININIVKNDQICAMIYGAVQKLIQDKETLEKTVYEQFTALIASQQVQISALQETVTSQQAQILALQESFKNNAASIPINPSHDTVTSLQNTVAMLQQTLATILTIL